MMHKIFKYKNNKAQAAVELAVFGAVLVFLIGSIVRNSLTSSQQQNTQLKAMRMALLQSYKGSLENPPSTGRMNSSVIYFEDRLTPDISRYGNSDRVQLFSMGSGTLTNLLFYPMDAGELSTAKNIPMVDLYVNGVHLPLTTAKAKLMGFAPPNGQATSYLSSDVPAQPNGYPRYKSWNFMCIKITDPLVLPLVEKWHGCPLFYSRSTKLGDYGVLTEVEAFDLNRNDQYDDDPDVNITIGKLARKDMAWHWKAINAIDLDIDVNVHTNTSFDVDNDGEIEEILGYTMDDNHIITSVTVMDSQDGDFDGSKDFYNGRSPGLQKELSILTQTNPDTYMVVKEGKLYNPENGQYARSVNFRDQVELVQRMFQLTNDTNRFCSGGVVANALPDGSPNPVEACGSGGILGTSSCFMGDNIKVTCFDVDSKMLYIRTRVLDKTGHAWLTDSTGKMP